MSSPEPRHNVPLPAPTYHALNLVARNDRVSLAELVDQVMSAYLETRLEAIHAAHHELNGRVINLAARRATQGSTRRPGRRSRTDHVATSE